MDDFDKQVNLEIDKMITETEALLIKTEVK